MKVRWTDKQRRFREEYKVDFNATRAAKRAGYSKKTAHQIGAENLKKPHIRDAIDKDLEKLRYKAESSIDRVLVEEFSLAYFDPIGLCDENGNHLPLHKLPEHVRRAIVGLEVIPRKKGLPQYKYRFSDKGKSLERLSRHLGMYTEKLKLGFTSETLNAILAALPPEFARGIREELSKLISSQRN